MGIRILPLEDRPRRGLGTRDSAIVPTKGVGWGWILQVPLQGKTLVSGDGVWVSDMAQTWPNHDSESCFLCTPYRSFPTPAPAPAPAPYMWPSMIFQTFYILVGVTVRVKGDHVGGADSMVPSTGSAEVDGAP